MATKTSSAWTPLPVLPGDDITSLALSLSHTSTLQTGTGLVQEGERLLVSLGGILEFNKPNSFYVRIGRSKIYVPKVNDTVIGQVTHCYATHYAVSLTPVNQGLVAGGNGLSGSLSVIGFDGASKRNRPVLEVGELVFCRVCYVSADKRSHVELTCKLDEGSSKVRKKDWASGEAVFGPLAKFGRCVKVDMEIELVEKVVEEFGKQLAFEVVIGKNHYVWVTAASVEIIIAITNSLQRQVPPAHIPQLISSLAL